MKKLKLNLQHLNNVEVLTREQLKKVMGGIGGSSGGGTNCYLQSGPQCPPGEGCCYNGGGTYSCMTLVPIGKGTGNVACPTLPY